MTSLDDANPKFLELLRLLKDQTARGRIEWQPTASSDWFRLSTSDGIIEVGLAQGHGEDDRFSDHVARLLDSKGRTLESVRASWTSAGSELQDFYDTVRRSVLRGDDVLDRMLSRFAKS